MFWPVPDPSPHPHKLVAVLQPVKPPEPSGGRWNQLNPPSSTSLPLLLLTTQLVTLKIGLRIKLCLKKKRKKKRSLWSCSFSRGKIKRQRWEGILVKSHIITAAAAEREKKKKNKKTSGEKWCCVQEPFEDPCKWNFLLDDWRELAETSKWSSVGWAGGGWVGVGWWGNGPTQRGKKREKINGNFSFPSNTYWICVAALCCLVTSNQTRPDERASEKARGRANGFQSGD